MNDAGKSIFNVVPAGQDHDAVERRHVNRTRVSIGGLITY